MIRTVASFAVVILVALMMLGAADARTSQQEYLACKQKLSKEPPCSSNWTKTCAARCRATYR